MAISTIIAVAACPSYLYCLAYCCCFHANTGMHKVEGAKGNAGLLASTMVAAAGSVKGLMSTVSPLGNRTNDLSSVH